MNIPIVLPTGVVGGSAQEEECQKKKEDFMEIEKNNVVSVNNLIKINMNIQNERGETPLHFAVS